MAEKLKLNLKNCYGIGRLEEEIEFQQKGHAIYAPNGVMKTSFAKTMMDISKKEAPSDLAFPERESVCEILLNDEPIRPDEIFVVKSYDASYTSEGVSTLLANEDLKKKYESVYKEIGMAKENFEKKLRIASGFGEKSREDVGHIVKNIFGSELFDSLLSIQEEIRETGKEEFSDADYKILFDTKVIKLLEKEDIRKAIDDFVKKYNELTDSSPILRKNFQYHHINQVHQQLDANNFFSAGHSISLCGEGGGEKTEYTSSQSLLDKIEAEKQRVISDDELIGKFNNFNSNLKNKELREFRDYITENKHVLPELQSMDEFKRKLWLQYILIAKEEYDHLLACYQKGQKELKDIIAEAKSDPNDWDKVIKDFNRRFMHLPFRLSVANKPDVILKENAPSIEFSFTDGKENRKYLEKQKTDLLRVLSTGEARALYILNIMFEIHKRCKIRKKTLFVFDDIADSFDYKNKFAIIDYLEDIVKFEDNNFLALVLTHNFDFLRTIENREICPSPQCRMAFKNSGGIEFSEFKRSDIKNPFHRWQRRLSEPVILIAYVPFLRNVIEYTQGRKNSNGEYNEDYLKLTKMLHFKDETAQLTVSDYKSIFTKTFPNLEFPKIDQKQTIIDFIFKTADQCLGVDDGINLEHKVVISIAIRILAERYIIGKIRSSDANYDPSKKKTGKLIRDFKERFKNQSEEIHLMKRINLMTPASIHINAFMYEPILDMGFGELKALYREVKKTLQEEN